ncbi:MAG: hypothetical protein AAF995_04535 [Planctomycetota bacterium]
MTDGANNEPKPRVHLRFCVHNAPPVVQRALESLGAEGHDCFGRCRRCFETPYFVTGNSPPAEITPEDVVEAETFDALLEKAGSLARGGETG